MSSLNTKLTGSVDIQKIQKIASECAAHILVGFPSGDQHQPARLDEDDKESTEFIENAELAKILSYGSKDIPARPFLEEGLFSKKDALKNALEQQAKKVLKGEKPNWDKVGTMARGAIIAFVYSDYYKTNIPNSKKTIEKKTVNGKIGDTPLIDSGNLMESLQFIVESEK